jgi:PAS domain S-box-containing protein
MTSFFAMVRSVLSACQPASPLGILRQSYLLFAVVFLCMSVPFWSHADYSPGPKKSVLFLDSFQHRKEVTENILAGVESAFKDQPGIELSVEHMDLSRIGSYEALQTLYSLYSHKYSTRPPDVLICSGEPAFQFVRRYGNELFPSIPRVFCGVRNFVDSMLEGQSYFTGVVEDIDLRGTLDLGFKLVHGAKQILAIMDSNPLGIRIRNQLERLVADRPDSPRLIFIETWDSDEIVTKLTSSSQSAFVMFLPTRGEPTPEYRSSNRDIIELVSLVSSFPILTCWENFVSEGATGGLVTSSFLQGKEAAEIAQKILAGTSPGDIPVVKQSPTRLLFDYYKLVQFGIPISSLPPNSHIINEPIRTYILPRTLVVSSLAIIVSCSVVIIGLVLHILSKRKTNNILRERDESLLKSRESLEMILKGGDLAAWDWDMASGEVARNDRWYEMFGYLPGDFRSDREFWSEKIHPEDRESVLERLDDLLQGKRDFLESEYRFQTKSGEYRWILDRAKVVQRDGRGKPIRVSGTHLDIQERKEAAALLEESQERLQLALDGANLGLWDRDIPAGLLFLNDRWMEILECSMDEAISRVQDWKGLIHPEDIDRVEQSFIAHQSELSPIFEIECRLKTKSDKYKWVLFRGKIVEKDQEGNPLRLAGTVLDISDRKAAENTLRESEEKYRLVVENAREGIFIAQHGKAKFCNSAFARMTGMTLEEIYSLSPLDLVNPQDRKLAFEKQAQIIRGEAVGAHYELGVIQKSGNILAAEVDAVRVAWDNEPAVLFFVNDITDRKTAVEKAVRQAKIDAAIADMSRRLLDESSSLEDLATTVLESAKGLTRSEFGYVGEIDVETGDLAFLSRETIDWDQCRVEGCANLTFPRQPDGIYSALWGHALNTRTGFFTNLLSSHPASQGLPQGHVPVKKFLSVPVVAGEQLVGQIALANPVNDFNDNDLDAVQKIADMFAMGLKRRRYEQLIQEAHDFTEKILSASPLGIATFRPDGKCVMANDAFVAVTDRTRDDFEKTDYRSVDSVIAGGLLAEADDTLKTGSEKRKEIHFITVLGREIWADVIFRRLIFSGKPHLLVIVDNITSRKMAETALRDSQQLLKSLFEAIPDLTNIIDQNYRIIMSNWKDHDMVPPEVRKNGKFCFECFSTLEEPCKECSVKTVFETGVPQIIEKYYPVDGADREIRSFPIVDEFGKITLVAQIVRDVTGRKQTEEALMRAQRFEAINALAGGVAHNFNNLLQIILGSADLAKMELSLGEHDRTIGLLSQISQSCISGAQTVKRLQDFARAKAGIEASSPESSIFDISVTVRKAVEMTKPIWKTGPEVSGVSVSMETDLADNCTVSANEGELFEVIINFVKNAVEAVPNGGKIKISTGIDLDGILLKISDNGVGVTKDNMSKLFTPFWTTKGFQATGMGLASSLGIVNRYHGEILVDSEEGLGTVFTVKLPFAAKLCDLSNSSADGTYDELLKVLCIDDDERLTELLQESLTGLGFQVWCALSGKQALEILETTRVDVVITDLGMPDMNGWQTAGEIRRLCDGKGEPVPRIIVFTGWDHYATSGREDQAGLADAILEKPVDTRMLARFIRDLVKTERM